MDRRPLMGYHGGAEQFMPSQLVDFAVAAEAAGFRGFTLSDHLHPWQDNQGHAGHAWIVLAAVAQRTERLLLGTGVTCPAYRYHPAEIAHAFATLAVLYPGRVFLGLGTGEAVNEAPFGGWGPHRERLERLVEAVQIMRRLWTGEWVDFAGRHYRVRGAKLYDVPTALPPVFVAASGPRSAAVAGREGDGWVTDAGTLRRGAATRLAFDEGARSTGKDPGTMPKLVELWAVVGDRDEALAAARRWQFLPVFNDVVNLRDPREVQRVAEERASPERVVEGWVASRDPDDHVAAIRDLWEHGATHIFVHSPQDDQRSVIDFYGTEVLPRVERA